MDLNAFWNYVETAVLQYSMNDPRNCWQNYKHWKKSHSEVKVIQTYHVNISILSTLKE